MKNSHYDTGARKQTVSVTLNADLYAQAKGAGNPSRAAEKALADAPARHLGRTFAAVFGQPIGGSREEHGWATIR